MFYACVVSVCVEHNSVVCMCRHSLSARSAPPLRSTAHTHDWGAENMEGLWNARRRTHTQTHSSPRYTLRCTQSRKRTASALLLAPLSMSINQVGLAVRPVAHSKNMAAACTYRAHNRSICISHICVCLAEPSTPTTSSRRRRWRCVVRSSCGFDAFTLACVHDAYRSIYVCMYINVYIHVHANATYVHAIALKHVMQILPHNAYTNAQ